AALTAPLALLALWLYRRAVLRSMVLAAGAPSPEAELTASSPPGTPLSVQAVGLPVPAPAGDAYRRGRRSLRRLALVHVLAGLAYASVFTAAWMIWVTPGFILSRLLWFIAVYGWMAAIVLCLVVPAAWAGRIALLCAYGAGAVAVAGYILARNPTVTPADLVGFWMVTNAPATALVVVFLARRVRAVGPLVLAFVTAGVAGAILCVQLAGMNEAVLRPIAGVGLDAGLDATGVFVALHVIGFAVFAVLGWFILRGLARRYQRKLLSDPTLVVYALVFGIVQSVPLAFDGWGLIATGLVAFAAYVVVARAAGRLLLRPDAARDGPTLLLLRVFALGQRSQRLFDALSTRWLRTGSVALIAGPDLVTATVEPHEFLDFVAGKLSRRFVRGSADLDGRLAELDTAPDRDGRFRTNEFFCHTDTWQETMRRLAR